MGEIKNASIKILCQSVVPFHQMGGSYKALNGLYRQNLADIVREGVEVHHNDLEEGFSTVTPAYNGAYNAVNIAQAIYRAARKGYDAAVIRCFLDSGLREARSIVDIPVMGACESSLLLACCLGAKFSIVTLTPPIVGKVVELVRQYGLIDRLANIVTTRLICAEIRELIESGKIHEVARCIEEAAEKTIREDNAEVIIMGCTDFGTVLTAQGVHEIKGIPVIDSVAAAVKMAELFVDMQRNLGTQVCRATIYSTVSGWEKEIPIKVP